MKILQGDCKSGQIDRKSVALSVHGSRFPPTQSPEEVETFTTWNFLFIFRPFFWAHRSLLYSTHSLTLILRLKVDFVLN